MKRNGRTSSGRIRWRCRNAGCGSSRTQSRDNSARDLRCGLDWLFSKQSQAEHRLPARTLRRRCELISSNPCDGIELPRLPKRKDRRIYLTITRLLALANEASNCRKLGEERRALILLLGFCGLRWGEAAGLQRRDLDFDAGILHVRRNLVYVNAKWAEGTPKNHERRDVPMPRIVMDALKPICEQREHEERVFRDVRGGPIRKQSLARETGWWTHTLTRLGWKRDDWPVPHDLRHTAASLAVHAGANVKALQRMLGHKNASMTLDVYADLFDSDLMDVARLLDAAVQVETGVEECGQNVGKNVLKPV